MEGNRERERESCPAAHLGGRRERVTHNTKSTKVAPTFFLLMKAKSFAAVRLPVWDALEWDTVGACVCVHAWHLWGLGKGVVVHVSFWGVLFVCKWCALELGMCKGMQDCLCQCDMLKHTLFIQRCRTVAGWRDTYRGGVPYRQCLSLYIKIRRDMILYLKLYLTDYIGIHSEKVSATDLTHKNPLKIYKQKKK